MIIEPLLPLVGAACHPLETIGPTRLPAPEGTKPVEVSVGVSRPDASTIVVTRRMRIGSDAPAVIPDPLPPSGVPSPWEIHETSVRIDPATGVVKGYDVRRVVASRLQTGSGVTEVVLAKPN